jgi:hypothetical protein
MIEIIASITQIFISKIATKLTEKLEFSKKSVCKELFRLFVILEELLEQSTSAYQLLEEFVENYYSLYDDNDFKQKLRYEVKDLLNYLKRYEKQLKKVFTSLKLLDDNDLSIKLTEIPESSYTLFKSYFVDDLAPKFIADRSSNRYVLRIAVNKKKHSLVGTNNLGHISMDLERLFKDGYLGYEIIDFTTESQRLRILEACSADLLKLKEVNESLKKLLKDKCDIQSLLN